MKRTFNHTAASYKENTRGNVGIMFAISALVLIGVTALAVDVANGYSAKQRLQDTTDAVALLAAKDKTLDTPAKLEEAAQALYDATYPGDTGFRIEIQDIIRNGDEVTVVSKNNIDTYFTGLFNTDNLDIGVSSSAVYSEKTLDIALVLDTTGSMNGTVPGDSGITKINSLKDAANGLIDTVENLSSSEVRLSVVPFAQYTNVGTSHSNASWIDLSYAPDDSWDGCVGSRLNGLDETPTDFGGAIPTIPGGYCNSEILPLTADMNEARASIDGLSANGYTYIPSGIVWGWRTLEGEIPERVAPMDATAEQKKVMVIMTDGENTRSKSGRTHNANSVTAANSKTANLCTKVKNDDIEVYTITYGVDDVTTQTLMRNCATSSDGFFQASSSDELNEAFNAIGLSLQTLRVSS